jgi:phospholipid N-methyltransferase
MDDLDKKLQNKTTSEEKTTKEEAVVSASPVSVQPQKKLNLIQEKPENRLDTAEKIKTKILQKMDQGHPDEEESIDIDPSLKRYGLDFTETLQRTYTKLKIIDEDAEIVSPGLISKLGSAMRDLETLFSGSKFDIEIVSSSINRITRTLDDLSLVRDNDLRKVSEDKKRALIAAMKSVIDSVTSLKRVESINGQLSKGISMMIEKAESAIHVLQRSLR